MNAENKKKLRKRVLKRFSCVKKKRTSRVRDQKKREKNCLEVKRSRLKKRDKDLSSRQKNVLWLTPKEENTKNVSSSRSKKGKRTKPKKVNLSSSRPKNAKRKKVVLSSRSRKGKIFISRLKILREFGSKKGFFVQYSRQRDPTKWCICVLHARIEKTTSGNSPAVYRVEPCLLLTWKMSRLELLEPANFRSRALQTEVELQNQCS